MLAQISTLVAVVVALSILCVGSASFLTAASGALFSNQDSGQRGGRRYSYFAPSSERLREKIRNYPYKMWKLYLGFCILYAVSIMLFIGLENYNDSNGFGVLSQNSIKNIDNFFQEIIFPGIFTLLVFISGYVVIQVRTILTGLLGEYSRVTD